MKTRVINIHGGPGCGKSTVAADVYSRMKTKLLNVELVREYVKNWAWRGHQVGEWDELYLYAKQLRAENALYDRVDWVVTDRPLFLSVAYERLYNPTVTTMQNLHDDIIKRQVHAGIRHVDFILKRTKDYVSEGRFETYEKAIEVDNICKKLLPHSIEVTCADDIMKKLKL